MAAARQAARATLRVGLATTAAVSLTAETMRRFSGRHPGIELSVRNTGFFDLTGGLDGGLTDVAFVRPPFRSTCLSMVTVYTEPRFAVLRNDHPLAAREFVQPQTWLTSHGSGMTQQIRMKPRSGRWRSIAPDRCVSARTSRALTSTSAQPKRASPSARRPSRRFGRSAQPFQSWLGSTARLPAGDGGGRVAHRARN
ncbi:MAG: LysR substrate-binding domain-containing protein [Solirubrobacteraceae bacterium]